MTAEAPRDLPAPVRGGDGRYRRDLAHVERDAEACRLASQGLPYSEIAARLGYNNRGDAYKAVTRVLRETARAHGTEELRQRQLTELETLRAAMWEDVRNPPPLVDRLGRIVHDADGQPIPDIAAKAAAGAVIIRAGDREARLRGLDMPKRSVSLTGHAPVAEIRAALESWNPADLHEAIEEAKAEIARLAAQNSDGTPVKMIPGTAEE